MNKVKFQFEMPKDNSDRLDELAGEIGVTKKEIINNALTLLEWAIVESKQGRILASVDEKEDKYKEVILPLLSAFGAAARGQAVARATPVEATQQAKATLIR